MAEIDSMVGPSGEFTADPDLVRRDDLETSVRELDRLLLSSARRKARWSDFYLHLHFGSDGDLRDIISMDWPSVRREAEHQLYADDEPVPVAAGDLGELVRARPKGPV
jgi:hypothetical protein